MFDKPLGMSERCWRKCSYCQRRNRSEIRRAMQRPRAGANASVDQMLAAFLALTSSAKWVIALRCCSSDRCAFSSNHDSNLFFCSHQEQQLEWWSLPAAQCGDLRSIPARRRTSVRRAGRRQLPPRTARKLGVRALRPRPSRRCWMHLPGQLTSPRDNPRGAASSPTPERQQGRSCTGERG
jgi:hypothetical protein